MRTLRNSTAGIGLAALGALGLTALSTPAFAQSFSWGAPTGGVPSTYAQQAIADAQNGGSLNLPGGLTYTTAVFNEVVSGVGQAIIDVQLPTGYHIGTCPATNSVSVGTGGTNTGFASVANVKCFTAANVPFGPAPNGFFQTNGDVVQVTVNLTSGTTPGVTGSITFGVINIAGTSPGLAMLDPAGTLTGNPDKLKTWCTLATNFDAHACELFPVMVQSSNLGLVNQTVPGSIPMAYSVNAKGVQTHGPSFSGYSSICVDMLYPYAPGNEFQQNCGDGEHPVTGGHRLYTTNTTSVADKGVIIIDLKALESQFEDAADDVTFRENPIINTITMTGTCGGLQLENIGSVAASCGTLPFAGENVWLVPIAGLTNVVDGGVSGPDTSPVPPSLGAGVACPAPDTVAGQPPAAVAAISYQGVVSGGVATFSNVLEPVFPTGQLPDGTDFFAHYEVCDYATEQAVIGDSAHWYVQATFDCSGSPAPLDCTMVNEVGGSSADALLPIQYNGKATYVNFTNGGFSEAAYLRIVNRMTDLWQTSDTTGQFRVNQTCVNDSTIGTNGAGNFSKGGAGVPSGINVPAPEGTGNFSNNNNAGGVAVEVVPGLTGDPTGLLNKEQTCEPVAQVVCKVTTDDGYNGYATLFTNNSSDPFKGAPGLLSGTNVFYPVYKIFQLAGIPWFNDAYNVYNYASMVCYAPKDVTITHVEQDYNHPLVNMQ
jgi:hypothetical protein